MRQFTVTVEFSGTKTYEIDAIDETAVYALFDRLSTFDTYDNPIIDRVTETIIKIEPETQNKPEPTPETVFAALQNLYLDYSGYYPSAVNNSPAMKAAAEILNLTETE
jgi:hypothetical protein